MDESLRAQIILAAKAGKLTEEQYQIYLQLLDDEEFRQEVEWDYFLDDALPVSRDAELYEASAKRTFPERKNIFVRYNYAIAASISLLLIAGALLFYFQLLEKDPILVGSRMIEFYSGDDRPEGQLGYSEDDQPVGEITLKWWNSENQKERINYLFCKDTLQLYIREAADSVAFNTTFKLSYFTEARSYFLESKDSRIQLENCSQEPKPLLK